MASALLKFSRVSLAMIMMCSTMTATRMLMQPKFKKITDSTSMAVAGGEIVIKGWPSWEEIASMVKT